jgi:hypothetical protein
MLQLGDKGQRITFQQPQNSVDQFCQPSAIIKFLVTQVVSVFYFFYQKSTCYWSAQLKNRFSKTSSSKQNWIFD